MAFGTKTHDIIYAVDHRGYTKLEQLVKELPVKNLYKICELRKGATNEN